MSTCDAHPSDNGRGSDAWSWSFTHFRLDRPSPSYCRVTFNNPPINGVTATTVAELVELVGLIEQDPDLNVVVFDSANPDFYLAAHDIEHSPGRSSVLPRGTTGLDAWLDVLVRLSRAPVVSIASIRGTRAAPEPSSSSPAISASRRGRTRCSDTSTLVGVSSPTAVLRPGSLASSVARGRLRSCSRHTISTGRARNGMGT